LAVRHSRLSPSLLAKSPRTDETKRNKLEIITVATHDHPPFTPHNFHSYDAHMKPSTVVEPTLPHAISNFLSPFHLGDTTDGDNDGETLVANGAGNQVHYLSLVASLLQCLLSSSTPRSLQGRKGRKFTMDALLAMAMPMEEGRATNSGGEVSSPHAGNPQIVGEVGRGGWGRP
jgi:hypothetical protein